MGGADGSQRKLEHPGRNRLVPVVAPEGHEGSLGDGPDLEEVLRLSRPVVVPEQPNRYESNCEAHDAEGSGVGPEPRPLSEEQAAIPQEPGKGQASEAQAVAPNLKRHSVRAPG